MQTYILPSKELRKLHKVAFHAQQRGHYEVCGVATVNSANRIKLHFLRNFSKHPYQFTISKREIYLTERRVRKKGERILATFHSHPLSEATPGSADIKRVFFNRYELIYDVCGMEPRLWYISKEDIPSLKELTLIYTPKYWMT